jgi:hypothetical protein
MKHLWPSFVIAWNIQHQKRPCRQCFFSFWSNQDEAPGTVLCRWNIQRQKRPCRQCFFLFWSNQDEAPGTVLCCWNIQRQKRPCGQCFFLFWSNQDEMPRTVLWHSNTHRQHDPQPRVMQPKEQQQTRIGLLSDQNVFVLWTTYKLMMASKRYSYR